MKLRYIVEALEDGYRAACPDLDLDAWGATESEAVDALRTAAVDQFTHIEAMAPPSTPPTVEVELVAEHSPPLRFSQGPADLLRN